MLHRSGPFNEETLIKSLKEYLPLNGNDERDVYDVQYMDEDLNTIMVANFVWLNKQWVFIDCSSL